MFRQLVLKWHKTCNYNNWKSFSETMKRSKKASPDSDSDEEVPKKTRKGKKGDSKKSQGKGKASTSKNEQNQTEAEKPTLLNKATTDYADLQFVCTKKNKLGEEHNLVISSWNVDGLRAWVKKEGLQYLDFEKPDILCLQETKCSEDKLPKEVLDIKNYKTYWCSSDKEGYAGVALLSKIEPIEVKYGIEDKEFDNEGRCIIAEYEKFFLVNVYVPNAGRGLVTLPKRLKWNDVFKEYVKNLDEKKPVIVCGDMNVAHTEIDLANPKTNTKNAGFTKEEREGLTEFLNDVYVDTFRHFYPDEKGAYTFWSYMGKARGKNVGWRLDYFIVSKRIMDNICDSVIRNQIFGSDHCPITLYLKM